MRKSDNVKQQLEAYGCSTISELAALVGYSRVCLSAYLNHGEGGKHLRAALAQRAEAVRKARIRAHTRALRELHRKVGAGKDKGKGRNHG